MSNRDNPAKGSEFEVRVAEFFRGIGLRLDKDVGLELGFGDLKKTHKFDLGSADQKVVVECKCHAWTEGKNSPSAKLSVWNEAMLYFTLVPCEYRKILAVARSLKDGKPLADYYSERYAHLVPLDVEIWEVDPVTPEGRCVHCRLKP